jgi:DNA-binding transcriptional LysR family regulator
MEVCPAGACSPNRAYEGWNLHELDLNLLRVLAALYRTNNVSNAAKELGLSQSSLSHALARLRDQLGDPLFVRVSRGVAPTALALALRPEVEELLERAHRLTRRAAFDPAVAVGQLAVATTDYFELVALPALLPVVRRAAPGLRLSLRPTAGELPVEALESGRVDVAIAGFYADVPEGFYQSALFTDGFVTAVPKGTPAPDVDAFFAASHALITLQGDFADRLARDGRTRTFAYGSASFTALPWVLAGTDLWLTAPGRLVERFAPVIGFDVHPCPVDVEPITLRMVWHRRTHDDPLRKWLRQQIRDAVAG